VPPGEESEAATATEEPRAVAVARKLREEILDGTLSPGERIKQDAVAKQFGVSRLPVREALRELAGEGLVTLERDVGARVTLLDPRELIEIYLLREAIEPRVAAETAERITDEQLADIWKLIEEGEAIVAANDVDAYLLNDREFHVAILEPALMPRALNIVGSLWQTAERYRRVYSILPHRLEISAVEHRMIVEALERRAGPDAEELYRIHIRRTRLTLAEHPELFPDGRPA
jgi:DNA-binding GntR family transcriptional regulator